MDKFDKIQKWALILALFYFAFGIVNLGSSISFSIDTLAQAIEMSAQQGRWKAVKRSFSNSSDMLYKLDSWTGYAERITHLNGSD